jgi:transposase
MTRRAIGVGIRELEGERVVPAGRQRLPGAGRKRAESAQPGIEEALDALVSPGTRGEPTAPLLWTTKSLRNLADALRGQGFSASTTTVRRMLRERGFSLQSTRKRTEGKQHPDRDAQFQHIHDLIAAFRSTGDPAVSVDAKKKELIGDFAQGGREWQPTGKPVSVRVHDFVDPSLGKATPYGVYDIANNSGWVSVGVSADTGDFATQTIRRWWDRVGERGYPDAKRLLITADGGGSNGYRLRAWKVGLQVLADEIGVPITVAHLPPGTSKWNRIEHRLFCHITAQYRGRPLVSLETLVELIAHTRTAKGLRVDAELDETVYPKGVQIDDEVMACLNIERDEFHGEWNYTIHPNGPGIAPSIS